MNTHGEVAVQMHVPLLEALDDDWSASRYDRTSSDERASGTCGYVGELN